MTHILVDTANTFFRARHVIRGDTSEKVGMAIHIMMNSIKKKNKKGSKKSEEPMVKVLNLNVNPENPRNGFFELDWNDEFVNMLKQSGYQGQTEEEIVDRWFQTLCRTIGNEQGIDVTGSGYVQINRRDDGKTEVS